MPGFDIHVDFMDMRDNGRLLARRTDVRAGFSPVAGRYVVVGDIDADPAVARVVTLDPDGVIELEVLPGDVESHRDLLTDS